MSEEQRVAIEEAIADWWNEMESIYQDGDWDGECRYDREWEIAQIERKIRELEAELSQ